MVRGLLEDSGVTTRQLPLPPPPLSRSLPPPVVAAAGEEENDVAGDDATVGEVSTCKWFGGDGLASRCSG